MKKIFLTIFLSLLITNIACAKPNSSSIQQVNANKLTKSDIITPEQNELSIFISKYDNYMNSHNEKDLRKFYADDYINADGINLNSLFKLLNETWKICPDIKFASQIQSSHVNDNYATIEIFTSAKGTTCKQSELIKELGELTDNSKMLIYLKKFGKTWKIISDRVLYEKTYLTYGQAKNFKFDLVIPEQVYAGTDYTASIYLDIPTNVFAMASINSEPIVYPQMSSNKEIFRQIPPDYSVLERVLKANTTNNNELNVTSIGFTQFVKDNGKTPQIKLIGLALIMQRVNVIPKSTFVHQEEKN